MEEVLIDVRKLCKYFWLKKGIIGKASGLVKAVEDVSLTVFKGKTTALVGESGSGKTTTGKTIIRIYKPTRGQILFNGNDVSNAERKNLKELRRQVGIVFQDPISSLNPNRQIGAIIADPMIVHKLHNGKDRVKRVKELLRTVELPEEYIDKRARTLSGGEAQRVAIARALSNNPLFTVLDEPTASLDVSVQAKILNLLRRLQKDFSLSYLLITHDLTVVRNFADEVYVMYVGKLMESSSTEELFSNPLHPYTRCLLSSIPTIFEEETKGLPEIHILEGEIPSPSNVPNGCRFHTRCPLKIGKICEEEEPEMVRPRLGHHVRCHKY